MYQFNQSLNDHTTLPGRRFEISAAPAKKSLSFLWRCSLLFIKACFILFCLLDNTEVFAQVIVIDPTPNIKAPSTTTMSSSASPILAGQPLTLSATVTSPAQSIPTGTVHFYNNTTNTDLTPGGIALSNGVAMFTTTALNTVTDLIATYSGDLNILPSTSGVFTQIITQPIIIINPVFNTTTTTLVSNNNPSVAGSQPVTFTATVSSSSEFIVDGLVDFYDNTNGINLTPAGVALSNGIATFTTSSLPFGDLNITATYRGNSDFQPSYSNSVIQRVQLTISGLSITLTSNLENTTFSTAGNSFWGDRVSFIATVNSGVGGAAGTVNFIDNGFLLGSATIDGSGKATLTTNLLTPGDHSITASYFSITSSILPHNVTQPVPFFSFGSPGAGLVSSSVSLIHSVGYNVISENERRFFIGKPSPYGKTITYAAFVSGLEGYTPTGSVLFQVIRDGIRYELGEVGLDPAGNALFSTSILQIGRDTVRAIYKGNDVYEPNIQFKIVEVEASSTTTTISSNLNPSIAGQQQVTFTATVATPFPGSNALAPGGTVIFNIDGVDQAPAPLSGNGVKAFLDISSLSPGSHIIKARYLGDGNYKGSSSGSINQVVERVGVGIFNYLGESQTTLVNTAFPNPLQFDILNINPRLVGGASVTFTAPLSGASGTFSNGTNSITVKTTKSGTAGNANSGAFTANGIAGTYVVTATIPGFGTNTFTMTNTATPVQITVGTSVPGLSFSVDGFTYTTTKTFSWEPGSSHALATSSPQSLIASTEYGFTVWSDGTNTLSKVITVPSIATSYIAQFQCLVAQEWVLNKDLDDYYIGNPVFACQSPGNGYVPKGDLKPGDCDDDNAAIIPQTWLLDADRDGYHEKLYFALPSCAPPQDGKNYINNSKGQDCNDADSTVHAPILYYVDADKDGYGSTTTAMLCSATAPVGYSTNSADCNDNDANIHAPISYYIDNDKDGYGSTVTAMLCSLTAPIGYSTNNTDCDDTDPTLNPATIPVINGLPLNINVSNNAGVCGATVSWTAPTTLVNCTGSSISQTAGPANGSQFPIGTTIVTYTVTDAALHTVNASFSVTVNDTEVPLAIAKNVTIYVDAYGTASVSPNTVNNGSTDNCSVLSVSLSKLNFTCADVGENVVTLTVNDIHGNSANVTATVTVKDNILPVAKCRNVEVYLDQNNTATITPGQVDNVSTDNCSIKTLVLSQTQFTAAGTYPVELTVTDVNGNIAKCNSTVTIKKRSVTLTYTGDNTEQYSDQQTLSATLKDDGSGNGVSGKTISFTIGSQTVTAVTNASGVASTTLTLTQNPDAAYTVATSFAGDGNYLAGADNDAFTIIDEDARVNYIGLMFQATPNVSTSTATVVLQASVIDIAAAVGDAAYDAFAGDIRNARVRFINRDNNTYLSGWLTPALVNNADLKVGTVSASYTFNIGTADAAQFTIGIEVGTPDGYYVRKSSDDNTVLTVYKPLGEFVTGGGYIIPTQSSGSYAATAGLKTNFGMNVKNNKTGTNLKGSVNIIFRRNVASVIRTYQIKANAMTSLGVGGTSANRKAQFLSKANLTDVTDPLNNISLGGNLDLRVDMTDKGEPGNTDSISVTLFNSSGTLLYSSNWIVSKTVQKVLSAGNININSASISPATVKAPDTKLAASTMEHAPSIFDVKVMNNPTMTSFRLKLESNDINTKFTLKVIDVVGRIIEIKEQLYAGQVIELGGGYFKGSYFAEVTQGRQRKVIKLIKMTSH